MPQAVDPSTGDATKPTFRYRESATTVPPSRTSDSDHESEGDDRSRGYSIAPTSVTRSRQSTAYTLNENDSANMPQLHSTKGGAQSTDGQLCGKCHGPMRHDEESGSAEKSVEATKIVGWDGPTDPAKPTNWSQRKKWTIVATTAFMTLMVSFASSVFVPTVFITGAEFNTTSEVMLLGVALYVLGFAFGPMIWGPASELYGRTFPIWVGMVVFCIFQIPLAVAKNLETIFVVRFVAGLFGSAPLSVLPGVFVDILEPAYFGVSVSVFAASVFLGPALGPIAGSFITYSQLGWRWTAWITLIFGGFFTILCMITTPETMEAALLRQKAQKLRYETKDFALHAKVEEEPNHLGAFVTKYLTKPVLMLIAEPILIILTIYMSLVYGILYLSFEAYPIAFNEVRGWSPGVASLPFIGFMIGILFACFIFGIWSLKFVARRYMATKKLNPEDRLPTMILGSFLLPVGLFWFAWTSSPSISWVPQVIAGGFIGCGIILIFVSAVVYIMEVYLFSANSAMAINTFVRSSAGAGFPMFSTYMFRNLGVDWAMSVLGFVCIALIPFPILFWKYGRRIRSWSRFAIVFPGT